MHRYLTLMLWIVTALSLHGCVGLGAWTLGSRTESGAHPTIHPTRGALDVHKAPPAAIVTSAAELRNQWGEPDRIESRQDGTEDWTYKTAGFRWSGVILYIVILPLPAMIPVGSQDVSFLIHNGRIEQATRRDWALQGGAYCGYFGMVYGGLGCGTGTFEEEQGRAVR